MELKSRFDVRKILAFSCLILAVFCLYKGFEPANAVDAAATASFAEISIPSIDLKSSVVKLKLEEHRLHTPDKIAGSFSRAENKTLIIGHSTTVFSDLDAVVIGNNIIYNDKSYKVEDIETKEKSEINMKKLLAAARKDTIVLMTCAGDYIGEGDATHRLIITAVSNE